MMVASLNIAGTPILPKLDARSRNIDLMGDNTSKQILHVFMLEGIIIGFVGTIVGTPLGLTGCYFLDQYQFHWIRTCIIWIRCQWL